MTSEQIKDYFEGMRDAENGIPHTEGRSAEYTKGYSDQYTYEQQHRGAN
jgi:hypothetical protein